MTWLRDLKTTAKRGAAGRRFFTLEIVPAEMTAPTHTSRASAAQWALAFYGIALLGDALPTMARLIARAPSWRPAAPWA